jgi:predicted transcriptional regulator
VFFAGVAESADLGRLPPRARAATSMFAFSRSESSTGARLISLVTALEVLAERINRAGPAKELVAEFDRLLDQEPTKEPSDETRRELDSLAGAMRDLTTVSIGSAVRALAKRCADDDGAICGMRAKYLADRGYLARSQLLHNGETDIDVVALLGPLEELLARALADAVTTAG